jgi:hypothetical protein
MTPPSLEKVAVIDRHANEIKKMLLFWIDDGWDEVMMIARSRHVLGHYEYGDSNLFEWSDGKVRAAILEELADAVVYQAWLLERARG